MTRIQPDDIMIEWFVYLRLYKSDFFVNNICTISQFYD